MAVGRGVVVILDPCSLEVRDNRDDTFMEKVTTSSEKNVNGSRSNHDIIC